jgi:putative tricarboxylic transport membrane protein
MVGRLNGIAFLLLTAVVVAGVQAAEWKPQKNVEIIVPHVATGKMRVIAISSPERLGGVLADVPTLRELGVDAVVHNWRTVIGPKGMTRAQVAYWDSVFSEMVKTADWQRGLEASLMENTYMNSAETRQYLGVQYERIRGILSDLGLAKR